MDGVDAALVLTDGETITELGAAAYEPYSDAERTVIEAAQTLWPGNARVDHAAEVVEAAHIRLLEPFKNAELVGFHGQTLAHDPDNGRTHQAGDGRRLAAAVNLPVVWDFRTSDVALGGQGAPLAPFYHFALARMIGAAAPIAFLNLGGIGNLTWVDPAFDRPEDDGACLAFDTGPANAPLDDLMRREGAGSHDEGGSIALQGTADETILRSALDRGYFLRLPPKSLDRSDFDDLARSVAGLSLPSALRTLTAFAAAAVADGLRFCPSPPSRVLVSGGGRLNRAFMVELTKRLRLPVQTVEEVGLDGDMLEAQAFAHLAVRVKRGLPTSCPGTTGVPTPVGGGTLSLPSSA